MWKLLLLSLCSLLCIASIYIHIGQHWSKTPSPSSVTKDNHITSPFQDALALVDHVYYINLDSRPDRRLKVEQELQKCNVPTHKMTRIPGVVSKFGALGCSLAHQKALNHAIQNHKGHIMVIEDDFEVLDLERLTQRLSQFKSLNIEWDMLLVSAWVLKYQLTDVTWMTRATEAQTTGGYIVHKDYIHTYLQNVTEGIKHLEDLDHSQKEYCIDQYWKSLQKEDQWYAFHPPLASQRDDFSDIENRKVSYHDKAIYVKEKVKPKEVILLSAQRIGDSENVSNWIWKQSPQWSIHLQDKIVYMPTDMKAYEWSVMVQHLFHITQATGLLYLSNDSPHRSLKYWLMNCQKYRHRDLWGDKRTKDQEWFDYRLDYPVYQTTIPQSESYVYISRSLWSKIYQQTSKFQHIDNVKGYLSKEQDKDCYQHIPLNPLRQVAEAALQLEQPFVFVST